MILQTPEDIELEVRRNPAKVFEVTSRELVRLYSVWWSGTSFAAKPTFAPGMPQFYSSLDWMGSGPFHVVRCQEGVQRA